MESDSLQQGCELMSWTKHDYDDIPGTYVFDGRHAHGAYALNKLLFSFNSAAGREQFESDPSAYCDSYGVTGEHKRLVLAKDYLGMLRAVVELGDHATHRHRGY
jgi:protocatechuate 4,5-dioxygenase, alpha chain